MITNPTFTFLQHEVAVSLHYPDSFFPWLFLGYISSRNDSTATHSWFLPGQEVPSSPAIAHPPLPVNASCDEQLLHVDACIKRAILFGDREALIPTTVQELETSHCERVRGELICIRSFGTTCLKLFPKTIFGLIRKNVEKVYKQLCRTQAGKESK